MKRVLLTILIVSTIWSTARATNYTVGDTTSDSCLGRQLGGNNTYAFRMTTGSTGGTLDSMVIFIDSWYGSQDSIIGFAYSSAKSFLGRSNGGIVLSDGSQDAFPCNRNTFVRARKISFAGQSITLAGSTAYWFGIRSATGGSNNFIPYVAATATAADSTIGGNDVGTFESVLDQSVWATVPSIIRAPKVLVFWSSGGGGGGGTPSTGAYKAASTKAGTFK